MEKVVENQINNVNYRLNAPFFNISILIELIYFICFARQTNKMNCKEQILCILMMVYVSFAHSIIQFRQPPDKKAKKE